jgi:rhombotail lipoprotein
MSYLYPDRKEMPEPAGSSARLQLPLRLGVAFVPPDGHQTIPAGSERQLLEIVKQAFQGRDWVKEIVVIPSNYLMPGGGFENLDQVSRMFGVDVVALASVDQLQSSDPGRISFLYLSIIGAYTLPLDRNDTRTLIDVAVFHIPTRTFLLRAPGSSHISGHSTAVEVNQTLREKSFLGMKRAMQDLTANLDKEITSFKASVVSGERSDVDILARSGESIRHSGSTRWLEAFAALLLAAALVVRR